MSDIEDLADRTSTLSLRQQRIISDIVNKISQQEGESTEQGTQLGPNTGVRLLPRTPNPKFVSKNHIPLSIGDQVEVLTTRKMGRNGDTAEVEVFNKLYVGIRLLGNSKATQHASKHLHYIKLSDRGTRYHDSGPGHTGHQRPGWKQQRLATGTTRQQAGVGREQ